MRIRGGCAIFPTHLEPICIIIYREGRSGYLQPVLNRRNLSRITAVRSDEAYILREFIHPEEVYNLDNILGIDEVIGQRTAIGQHRARIGIAGLNGIMDAEAHVDGAAAIFSQQRVWMDVEDKMSHAAGWLNLTQKSTVMRYCIRHRTKGV